MSDLDEMWEEMTGTLPKRIGVSAIVIAALIWNSDQCTESEDLLRNAVETFLLVNPSQ